MDTLDGPPVYKAPENEASEGLTPPTRNHPIWVLILRIILLLISLFTWSVLSYNIHYYNDYAATHTNMGDEGSWGLWIGVLFAEFVTRTIYFPAFVLLSIPSAYYFLRYRYKDRWAAITDHILSSTLFVVFLIICYEFNVINNY